MLRYTLLPGASIELFSFLGWYEIILMDIFQLIIIPYNVYHFLGLKLKSLTLKSLSETLSKLNFHSSLKELRITDAI